jgi:hypothetical protein
MNLAIVLPVLPVRLQKPGLKFNDGLQRHYPSATGSGRNTVADHHAAHQIDSGQILSGIFPGFSTLLDIVKTSPTQNVNLIKSIYLLPSLHGNNIF